MCLCTERQDTLDRYGADESTPVLAQKNSPSPRHRLQHGHWIYTQSNVFTIVQPVMNHLLIQLCGLTCRHVSRFESETVQKNQF